MKMNNLYIMFLAACIVGGLYFFYPVFILEHKDTFIVGFGALAYLFFVRPWLKNKLGLKKNTPVNQTNPQDTTIDVSSEKTDNTTEKE